MAVTTSGKMYDNPSIIARRFQHGSAAAGTLAQRAQLVACTPLEVYQLWGYVTVAGTVSTASVDAVVVSGTTTTTVTGTALGTATANTTFQIDLTTSAVGPTLIAQGGYAYAQFRTDATVTAAVVWEYALQPTSGIANPA